MLRCAQNFKTTKMDSNKAAQKSCRIYENFNLGRSRFLEGEDWKSQNAYHGITRLIFSCGHSVSLIHVASREKEHHWWAFGSSHPWETCVHFQNLRRNFRPASKTHKKNKINKFLEWTPNPTTYFRSIPSKENSGPAAVSTQRFLNK